MKFKFLVLLFITTWFLHPVNAQISSGDIVNIDYSSPKEYVIAGITVSGVKYLDNNVLIMLSGLTIGDKVKIPGDKITQAIRKLWDQGLFEDVKISITQIVDNQIYLNLYLKERPRLSHFSFNGIKKSDADNIREKIHITKGEYVTDNMIMRTKNIIRIMVESRDTECYIGLDSRIRKLDGAMELVIKKEQFKIRLLRMSDRNFFETIRAKLKWGLDIRN
jgi:outer membrane protein insertion porin family